MSGLELVALGVLLLILLPIVYFDVVEQKILNGWLIALGVTGVAYQVIHAPKLMTLALAVTSVATTAILLLAFLWILKALKRPAAIGGGDLKFLVAASAWLGFVGAAVAFVLAALASVLWALAVSPWQGFDLRRQLPFAPFLAIGALATFVIVGVSN